MTAARPGASLDPIDRATTTEGKGAMDRLIETLASGFGNSIGWMAEHWVLFGVFAVLWIAFLGALIFSQGSLDQAWSTIQSWPLILQGIAWLLFLPVVGGLWVWETTWPFIARIVLVLGLAGFNLMVMIPRAAAAKP